MDRAVADLGERLPHPLRGLAALAYNYRWSWLAEAATLFRDIDPERWRVVAANPRELLEGVTARRWAELARDAAFVARVEHCAHVLAVERQHPPAIAPPLAPDHPVAYFCSEFGIHSSLPIYGGGLGILAGDILKTASDLRVSLVGIGMLYRQGYFHQQLDGSGWQREYWTATNIERLPAVLVTEANGTPVTVEVEIGDHPVRIQVWRIDIGRTPLYLLDTDRDDNRPIDRWISARLYVGDRQMRLAQYAVLGIGGVRALAALGIEPALVHLNEGHASLSGAERLRERLANGLPLPRALTALRAVSVFTTHTPVPAGNEAYRPGEIDPVLARFVESLGIPRSAFFDLGRVTAGRDDEPLNLTALALRTSGAANGVSRLHGQVARTMWAPLWNGRPADEVPITHVTNGVHTTTWMALAMQGLLDRHLGADWRGRLRDPALWAGIDAIPDTELWAVRNQLRAALVAHTTQQSVRDRLSRGDTAVYAEAAAAVFDPTVLTIGFARRVATYKRLHLLARNPERGLLRVLGADRPSMQVIVAGKAHPADSAAKEALRDGFQQKIHALVGRRVVFLEDYDLSYAPLLVAGVDLWLNLPRPPLEASGTSGMKVVCNGGLNLSVRDGWWAEAYDGENGWVIESPEGDPHAQDDHDAAVLFDLLEQQVIPLFHERDAQGIPHGWLRRVKASMRTLIPQFSAERMLRDYLAGVYPHVDRQPA